MKTARKRKKDTRQRGTTTHGFGSMKKNRGAGNRGGRGRAGTGKRGDANKQYFRVKEGKILGSYGFSNNKYRNHDSTINIYAIENSYATLKAKGLTKEHNGMASIDMSRLGCTKLLGTGKPSRKYEITVEHASESAMKKISAAGGTVKVTGQKESSAEESSEESPESQD